MLFKPSDAGRYDLRVNVKDSANKIVKKDFTVIIKDDNPLKNESTISTESTGVDTGITLSTQAAGGTEPYRYAYYYKKTTSNTWTKLSEEDGSAYVTEKSMLFKPSDAGEYDLRVNVKDSKNNLVQKNFTVTIKDDDPLKNESTISAESTGVDTGIILSAQAAGGTEPYRYAYYYKKTTSNTWTKLSEEDGSAYVTEKSMLFKPSDAGEYDLRVNVKDSTDKKIQKNFTVTIK